MKQVLMLADEGGAPTADYRTSPARAAPSTPPAAPAAPAGAE